MADKAAAVKARFVAEGVTIKDWARANGFTPKTVYRVLAGEAKCKWGESHRIAVALGLKKLPDKMRFRSSEAA